MTCRTPRSWREALETRAGHPDAVAIAGGTDVMVGLNFGRSRPAATIDLTRVPELRHWSEHRDHVVIGAGVPYTELIGRLAGRVPALAGAARTVGSVQIRNRGTLGGNVATASPAGDTLPVLIAADAAVDVESVRGSRRIPAREFFVGPKRTVLAADELIRAVRVPLTGGTQLFSKIGPRSAMTIAVCSFALVLDERARTVGTGIGSSGPVPLRAPAAEEYLTAVLADRWDSREPLGPGQIDEFAELSASATRAIDDVRSTAHYRRHAVRILARRALSRVWTDHCEGIQPCT